MDDRRNLYRTAQELHERQIHEAYDCVGRLLDCCITSEPIRKANNNRRYDYGTNSYDNSLDVVQSVQ
jgi:hypothetical protein